MTKIKHLNTKDISGFSHTDPQGIAVIMPCIDREKGEKTAQVLKHRAGIDCEVLVVLDDIRQGFIKTLNAAATRVDVKYIVYLAQDAYPGREWLKCAYDVLENTGKGLLAFNDGKWHGYIASFGMVRTSWVKTLYNGPVLFPGYKSHAADNEITVIARCQDMHIYDAMCTLVEYDPEKAILPLWGKLQSREDKILFKERFKKGFDGLASLEKLKNLSKEYKVEMPVDSKRDAGVSFIISPDNPKNLDDLLKTFFEVNTVSPFELIIIGENNLDVTQKYGANAFIRIIRSSCNELDKIRYNRVEKIRSIDDLTELDRVYASSKFSSSKP